MLPKGSFLRIGVNGSSSNRYELDLLGDGRSSGMHPGRGMQETHDFLSLSTQKLSKSALCDLLCDPPVT